MTVFKDQETAHQRQDTYFHDCRVAGVQPDADTVKSLNDAVREADLAVQATKEANRAALDAMSPQQYADHKRKFLDDAEDATRRRAAEIVVGSIREGGLFVSPTQVEADKRFAGDRRDGGGTWINGGRK